MKKLLSVLLMLVLLMSLCLCAFAEGEKPPLLVDEAGLLTGEEFSLLNEKLEQYSAELNFDIVVVTVNDIGSKTPMEYADDYYDYNGYGYGDSHDGCLLLLSMAERDYWISTTGYGITALTDYGIKYISDKFIPSLSSGDYYGAFDVFANYVRDFVIQARDSEPFDINNKPADDVPKPKTTGEKIKDLFISLIVSLVISAIITLIVKKGYTNAVRFQKNANNYLVQGSLRITGSYDNFLYSNVTKTRRQTESSGGGGGSSTHSSSSGTSHGGGGGKF